jgi:TonB-linked SusC/RagA family outer membrane protein
MNKMLQTFNLRGKFRLHVIKHIRYLLIIQVLLPLSISTYAQDRISIDIKKDSLKNVLSIIQAQGKFRFLYSNDDVNPVIVERIKVKDASVNEVLSSVLRETDLTFQLGNDNIIYIKKAKQNRDVKKEKPKITGKVIDTNKQPLPGTAVIVKGTKNGVATDIDGNFELSVDNPTNVTLQVSFLGMKKKEVVYKGQSPLLVMLENEALEMKELVLNGVVSRKAESFTGSSVTVRGEELKRVGNQNVFQSLKNLDPSVFIIENFTMGSDPNTLPNMNMRGGTSFDESLEDTNLKGNYENKPNQPLFILDGFEATAEKIFDMDMNIVESLTILKDASAKALYGSKAANGVVVIETKRLLATKPRVTYTGSVDLTMPDLSSYNLCNALEKLDVEFRENVYYTDTWPTGSDRYYALRKQVLEGLDVYWLSKPVQMGVGQKHSLNIELGKDELRTSINIANYNNQGVMIGSGRNTLSGGFNIMYQLKKLRFQNNFSFTNNNASDSPYGSFSTYTLLNPYLNPYDEYGNLLITLSNGTRNPLNDGTIGTSLTSKYFELTNNFQAEYQIKEGLKVRGRFSVTKKSNSADRYYPTTHSKFSSYSASDMHRKGQYEVNYGSNDKLSGDIYVNYNKTINDKHNLFLTAGSNMSESKYREEIHYTEGFPSTNMNDIMFALQYNSTQMRPSGISGFSREVGFLTMLSYTYMDRFLFDGTYRLSASSMFGNANRWATFWSLGIGWNLHKEHFMKDFSWIKQLKIRGSVGSTGNQNFLNNKSLTVYKYYSTDRYTNLIGSYATNMENPELKWEHKMDYDIGIDADIYNLNIRFDIYKTITQNMVTSVSTAPSTGFTNASANLGKVESKGLELLLSYTLFQNSNGFFRLNGSYTNQKNTLLEISEAMKAFNDRQLATINNRSSSSVISQNTQPVILYYDGLPMNTIWAVPSYGIDPATGIELLKGVDGQATYIWKASDMVPSGVSVPKWRGNFGFNGEYKGIGISVTCTYLGGGQLYNQTLVNKIENIAITSNFDRRVLSERWGYLGQMAQYKRNTGSTPYNMNDGLYFSSGSTWNQEPTRPTQRFVQDQNELNISSISVYYDFCKKWLATFGLERLKFTAYMNDIAKFSTIRIERGTSYPFARTISFSLTGTF